MKRSSFIDVPESRAILISTTLKAVRKTCSFARRKFDRKSFQFHAVNLERWSHLKLHRRAGISYDLCFLFAAGVFTVGIARYAALEFSPANAPAAKGSGFMDALHNSAFFTDNLFGSMALFGPLYSMKPSFQPAEIWLERSLVELMPGKAGLSRPLRQLSPRSCADGGGRPTSIKINGLG